MRYDLRLDKLTHCSDFLSLFVNDIPTSEPSREGTRGAEGQCGRPSSASCSNPSDQEFCMLDEALHSSMAFRTTRRARWNKADWDLVSYIPHLTSIDFPNQPFNLRPESWELVLHYIPDNIPVNTKIVMN